MSGIDKKLSKMKLNWTVKPKTVKTAAIKPGPNRKATIKPISKHVEEKPSNVVKPKSKLPPSYKTYALIKTYHPKFVFNEMQKVYSAFTKGITILEDKAQIIDTSNWACYGYYSCDKRCARGACLFKLIQLVENWLTKEGNFELFVGMMRIDDPLLFKMYEEKKKKENDEYGKSSKKKPTKSNKKKL